MCKKQLTVLILTITVVASVLAYHSLTSAATVNEIQAFNKDVLFRGTNNTFKYGLRVGQEGRGGVAFFSGTIVNDSATDGQDNPIIIGDNLRVDGALQRGGMGGDDPLKVSDSIIPTRSNVFSLGSDRFRFQNGYFSGTVDMDTLTIAHLGSSDVIATNNIIAGAVTGAKILDGEVTSTKIYDGTVGTADLADSAVTTVKIANSTITGDDISSIADLSINSLTATTNAAIGTTRNDSYALNIGKTASDVRGLRVDVSGSGTATAAIEGKVTGTATDNYAGKFNATAAGKGPSTTNYGVYSQASGATTNWAGYFAGGDVYIANSVGIGTTDVSSAKFTLGGNARLNGAVGIGMAPAPATARLAVSDNSANIYGANVTFTSTWAGSGDGQAAISGLNNSTTPGSPFVAGVYGLANGAGAATNNVGVYGKAFGSTVSNRAGYFWVNNSVDNDWIAEFYNKSTDSNADGIAIKINVATPGNNNNYVQFNKDSSAVGNIDGDGAGGVRYNTSGADFAEYFPAAENVEAGQLVSLNRDGKVQRAQPGDKPFGVVSSGGAFVGGKNYHPTSEDKSVLVALLGQVPVAVNNEKGAILPGDKIALSSQTGIGCKAQAGEDYVGIALEPLTNASGQIKVLVSVLASD